MAAKASRVQMTSTPGRHAVGGGGTQASVVVREAKGDGGKGLRVEAMGRERDGEGDLLVPTGGRPVSRVGAVDALPAM
jgi:hypothetical protein